MKRILYSICALVFIGFMTFVIIAYGKGYRLNFQQKTITSTGILSVSSSPDGASVWIDGKLVTATNGSISLQPNWYTVRIGKNGYTPWEKSMRVQGEVVSRADALLIRSNPSLRSLTDTGVYAPVLSPTGGKIAYLVTDEQASFAATLKLKTGVWVFDLKVGPLGGAPSPRQIYQTNAIEPKDTHLIWSPDEKQILLIKSRVEKNKEIVTSAYQLSVENTNLTATNITSSVPQIKKEWDEIEKLKHDNLIATLATPSATLLSKSSSYILFSPDDSKILYLATDSATLATVINPPLIGTNPTDEVRTITAGTYYIYDVKEDKNYPIASSKEFPSGNSLIWYTDSKHIIIIEKESISIIDYDGTNKRTVYSGPFMEHIVYPSPNGGKLLILTSLNKPQPFPNLYEVDLQ